MTGQHPEFQTPCPDCGRLVGATQSNFNRTELDGSSWRIALHNNPLTRLRCTSARAEVKAALVWRNPRRERVGAR